MKIAVIVLFLLALVLVISYICYRIAFYSPKKNRDVIPDPKGKQYEPHRAAMRRIFAQLAAREYEDVSITSQDGLTLWAKYYHIRDGAPLAIAFHGYRSSGMSDFAGGSEACFEMGQNLLLIEQRAHARSQGNSITFGIEERRDCLEWVKYAANRFGPNTPILLYGISMGAATVLMASGQDLPENVKGIVADCPYSSPVDIILEVCHQMHYPPKLAYPFILLGARIFGHFELTETTAAEEVKKAKVPILIIHGEADHFVPESMSAAIQASRPDIIQRETFPDAGHGISFLVDEARYKKIVGEFTERVLK